MDIGKIIVEIGQATFEVAESSCRVVISLRRSALFSIEEEKIIHEYMGERLESANSALSEINHKFPALFHSEDEQANVLVNHKLMRRYAEDQKEFEKRFIALLIQRLQDSCHVDELASIFPDQKDG